jgi:serine/threonine-protein kinase
MSDARDRLKAALAERYVIERTIGAGGMATVYLAADVKHNRQVAVKVLRPSIADLLGSERFLREIGVTARLDHPHIVALYDSGEAGGFLYYVMPYVEGESLRQRLERVRRFELEEALHVVHHVASALHYAHERGLIHRDIKPENVLLSAGQARVADFGLARALNQAGGTRLTATGIALGTPEYMSPEQCLGSANIDERSDVYALGCLTYEMLAGGPPFATGSEQQVLAHQVTRKAPSLGLARSDLPKQVIRAVDRTLIKNPAHRFANVVDFEEALTTSKPSGQIGARWGASAAIVASIRATRDDKLAGTLRLVLALLFLMTGAMKLLVPALGEAFSSQLQAANLPLYTLTRVTVPFVEIGLGALLLIGLFSRVAVVLAIGIMLAATYVHLAVDDPSLFPLQPSEPIIPLVVIAMSSYVLWRGAGAWSLDLAATPLNT